MSSYIDKENRRIVLVGDIDEELFSKVLEGFTKLLRDKERGKNPITLVLNSHGGNPYQALAICELIKASPAEVTVHTIGQCMSASVYILQAAHNGCRVASPLTYFLIHNGEETSETGATKDHFTDLDKVLERMLAERTGRHIRTVSKWHKGETYFTAAKALKVGLIDRIEELK